MAAGVARQVISYGRLSPSVNPLFYDRMVRFFEMDREADTFTGLVCNAKFIDVEVGKISAEFIVDKNKIQHFGTLHGGCTATMVDCITTAALIVTRGVPGVSVNLNLNYLAPAPIDSLVRVYAEVVRHGKSIAFTKASLFRVEDGVKVASATHTLAFNPRIYVREKDEAEINFK